jgi:hypothetical protein
MASSRVTAFPGHVFRWFPAIIMVRQGDFTVAAG